VTIAEPGLTNEQQPPAREKSGSRAKRILEWFWRGAELREKKRSLPEPTRRQAVLAQRAQSSLDLALNTAELARSADADKSSFTNPEQASCLEEASANEFYRQSCYWSLSALQAQSDEHAGTSYSEAVWDTLDERLLESAAQGERTELLRTALRSGSFVYFAELPASERVAITRELRKLAESLLFKVGERTRVVQGVLLQRAFRLSLLFLMVLLVGAGLVWERKTREERSDLARGAPWRASSKWEDAGCSSPDQQCDNSPAMFFHTKEEKDPWVEFDLGALRQVATVQVDNRVDCCMDRTIPLIVEVSDNHKRWRQVARRDTEFKTWRATFSPTSARWVRLRINRESLLHLARVRIFAPQH